MKMARMRTPKEEMKNEVEKIFKKSSKMENREKK